MKVVLRCVVVLSLLAACSNSSPGGDDAGATVNGCSAFTDGTTVTGPSGPTPAQYSPACVHVKVGQSVTFNLDFSDHPMQPFGGDTGNPIQETTSGTTATFTFASAGTFGFHCEAHPSIMQGAVQVTP